MSAQPHTAPATLDDLQALSESELSELVGRYPYVAIYRIVLAGKMKLGQHPNFRDALHKAALHSPDRSRLYTYLHTDIFEAPDVATPEAPATQAGPFPSHDITEQVTEEAAEAVAEVAAEGAAVTGIEAPASAPPADALPAADEVAPEPRPAKSKKKKKAKSDKSKAKKAKAGKGKKAPQVPPADDVPSLKDAVLRKAAGRQVSLEEKHSFLEWLDILEDPDGLSTKEPIATRGSLQEGYVEEAYASSLQLEAARMEEAEVADEEFDELPEVRSLADKSIALNTGLATETLAKIMLKQGKIHEAIAVYEALRLKYPEKSDYFAALIKDLKAG